MAKSIAAARPLPITRIHAVVTRVEPLTEAVRLYEIAAVDGATLPRAEAGAHIALALPDGVERSYSLIASGARPQSYTIAVKLERGGRGGSRHIHERLVAGSRVEITPPRNNFPLNEGADITVLIAGGIGISPILNMADRLEALGRYWTMYYACRSRSEAPFLPRLEAMPAVRLHFDDEQGGPLPLRMIVAESPAAAHLYCCGPGPMLQAFETAASSRPADRVHVEYFTPREAPAVERGYVVRLAQSGRELHVRPGQTLLGALRNNGVDVPFSCEEGICGACEVRVVDGRPDHRDSVLSDAERAANRTLMACCSGSLGPCLTLDL